MTESWDNPAYDAMMAYQKTAAVTAAVKLDVFTLIGSGASTCDALSEKTGASRRGLRILCDFLTVIGLLRKEGSAYALTPASGRYLDRASPAAMGGTIDFLAAPEMLRLVLGDPVSYVRQGGSSGLANLAPDNAIWVRFAKAMTPLASLTAKRTASFAATLAGPPRQVLDVAAGHGLYGIEIARKFPDAVVTAIDWAGVLDLARANAEAAGVGGRYRTIAGSAFDVDWGSGYDLVLLANFLHHFSREDCVRILRKVRSGLSPNGKVLAIDFVPGADRVSPPMPAAFAFWMLATTPSGDAYTAGDLDEIAREAGFGGATARPLKPTPETLVMFER
jgi:ubiquinone/menaquinone biosynthesis C-methylase UbiE